MLIALLTAPAARADLPSPQEIAELQSRLEKAHQALDDPKLSLSASDRAFLSAKLAGAERYFRDFVKLSSESSPNNDTSKALVAVGGVVLVDDATVIGAADDFLLPFIAVGLYVTHFTRSSEVRPASQMWNATLLQLQLFAAAVTMVAAAQRKPGCACKCLKKGTGPIPVDRMVNAQACAKYCWEEYGFPGSECGGVVTWSN